MKIQKLEIADLIMIDKELDLSKNHFKCKGDYPSYHYDSIEDIKNDEIRNNVFDTKEETTTFLFINLDLNNVKFLLKMYYFNDFYDDVTFHREV
jgi:hypothetical protein